MNRMESSVLAANKAKGNRPAFSGSDDLEYCEQIVLEDKLRKILEMPKEDQGPLLEKLPLAERTLFLQFEAQWVIATEHQA